MRQPKSWDNVWSEMAIIIATKSKDPNTQVGAVIVSPDNMNHRVGYNGLARGIEDTEERWQRPLKYDRVIHAEANAIVFSKTDLTGWTLYVTMFPCSDCANLVIQAGITRVVYSDEYSKHKDWGQIEQILADFQEASIIVERHNNANNEEQAG